MSVRGALHVCWENKYDDELARSIESVEKRGLPVHVEREEEWPVVLEAGRWTFTVSLPHQLLNEGVYRIDMGAALYYRGWTCKPGVKGLSIFVEIQGGLSDSPYWMGRRLEILAPVLNWAVSQDCLL